jgi:hypothetical protein
MSLEIKLTENEVQNVTERAELGETETLLRESPVEIEEEKMNKNNFALYYTYGALLGWASMNDLLNLFEDHKKQILLKLV